LNSLQATICMIVKLISIDEIALTTEDDIPKPRNIDSQMTYRFL
jgi:hypothetical protein